MPWPLWLLKFIAVNLCHDSRTENGRGDTYPLELSTAASPQSMRELAETQNPLGADKSSE